MGWNLPQPRLELRLQALRAARPPKQVSFPGADLVRMHAVLTGQFVKGLLTFGGFHGNAELEVDAVPSAFSSHSLNFHVPGEYTRFLTLARGPVSRADYTQRTPAPIGWCDVSKHVHLLLREAQRRRRYR